MQRQLFKFLSFCLVLSGLLMALAPASAQTPTILYPTPGEQVRGEIVVRFNGVPNGGYAVVRLDGELMQATAENNFPLNTFTLPEGTKRLSISGVSSSGKTTGTAEVSFEVANQRVDTTVPGVKLTHWVLEDIYDDTTTRYNIFAESIASISDGAAQGEGGAGGAGGGGGSGGGIPQIEFVPAPLDWQVAAEIRTKLRDVGMIDDSANIKSVVQRAFQRQRLSESGGPGGAGVDTGGAGGGAGAANTSDPAYIELLERILISNKGKLPSEPILAPWASIWNNAPETGANRVKMITQVGREIIATDKPPAIGLVDLLPSFPEDEVRPGSKWQSNMTILGELSTRSPIKVVAPMSFTSFENIRTPGGETVRAAKLEARFPLPTDQARKEIAAPLSEKIGAGAGEGAGGGAGAGGTAGGENTVGGTDISGLSPTLKNRILEATIKTVRTNISRVLWFDIEKHRIVRTEDRVNTYFEFEPIEGAEGGGGGGAGGAAGEAAEPTKVNYNLRTVMWLDDKVPAPTDKIESFNIGTGPAHSRDSVTDPSLTPVLPVQNP